MEEALRNEIRELMQAPPGPCVSIFMPTHRAGAETGQDRIRFGNLLKETERELLAFGMRVPEARELLGPAHELHGDGFFWRNQSDGLAVFLASGLFKTYRFPIGFKEMASVGGHFHLKPLFPLFSGDGRFFILTLSQKGVRLFRCNRFDVSEVPLDGVPKSMDEYFKAPGAEQYSRFHTRVVGTRDRRGGMFRGHGTDEDDNKTYILQYLQKVDEGVRGLLGGDHAPLVVAGVDYLLPLYREANSYPHLQEQGITGNADGLSARELHREAWEVVRGFFRKDRESAAEKFNNLLGTGLASGDMTEILAGSRLGRVESLFVPHGMGKWGKYDPERGLVELSDDGERPGDIDLLDLAAVQTFQARGSVYAVPPEEVPGGALLAAVFRY